MGLFIGLILVSWGVHTLFFYLANRYHKEQVVFENLIQKEWVKVDEYNYKTICESFRIEIRHKSLGDDSWYNFDLFKKGSDKPSYHTWVCWMHVYIFDRKSNFNSLRKITEMIDAKIDSSQEQNSLSFLK